VSTEWWNLVKWAKTDNKGMEMLLTKLDPIFRATAKQMCAGRMVDDLMQVARIKVWQSLGKVNAKKAETIKQYFTVVGINAMKDELTRHKRRPSVVSCDDVDEAVLAVIPEKEHFDRLLSEYKKYIKQNGSFKGAHKELAGKHDVSVWVMRTMFHRAIKDYIEELNK